MSRFLLVRLGALGDIVHAIPVAAALRRAFPQARIDWLVSAKHREILDLVPVLDRRLAVNDRPSRPPFDASASARPHRPTAKDDEAGMVPSPVEGRPNQAHAERRGGTTSSGDGEEVESRADPAIPMLAAVRELRKARYDVVIDMQGLIKSAVVARSVGAGKVIGFSREYLREGLAKFLYTDVHDPGGEGILRGE